MSLSSVEDHRVLPMRWVMVSEAFDEFLGSVKGVAEVTRECYLRHVKPFLQHFSDAAGALDLRSVSQVQVRSYVTDLGRRYAPMSLKLIATAIRSFLGFAWMSGWTRSDLTGAVGVVVTHRSGHLPKSLPAADVLRLLQVPDRTTAKGARDYAILVMLSRLGLRAGEVAGLQLDGFDWRSATIVLNAKGGHRLVLPLPQDVGEAVVAYLYRRPYTPSCRHVFLQVRGAPAPLDGRAVTQIVARHAARASLGVVRAHRLRHSAARAVLAAGGTLAEVGELLGHQTPQVTMMYASFDFGSLAVLTRPWPVAR